MQLLRRSLVLGGALSVVLFGAATLAGQMKLTSPPMK